MVTVNNLIKENTDPKINSKDALGLTLLHRTISNESEFKTEEAKRNHVRVLISRGADVSIRDAYGETPLHYAASYGHLTVAEELLSNNKLLINEGNKWGSTPLHKAAANGHYHLVKYLLEQGANPNLLTYHRNGYTPYELAVKSNQSQAVIQLLQSVTDRSKAERSIQRFSRQSAVKYKHTVTNEDVENEIKNNFLTACIQGNLQKVKQIYHLYHRHLDLLNSCNWTGNTPLHLAVYHQKMALIDYLISKGADMYRLNETGETPFFVAFHCYEGKAALKHMDDEIFYKIAEIFARYKLRQAIIVQKYFDREYDPYENPLGTICFYYSYHGGTLKELINSFNKVRKDSDRYFMHTIQSAYRKQEYINRFVSNVVNSRSHKYLRCLLSSYNYTPESLVEQLVDFCDTLTILGSSMNGAIEAYMAKYIEAAKDLSNPKVPQMFMDTLLYICEENSRFQDSAKKTIQNAENLFRNDDKTADSKNSVVDTPAPNNRY